MSQLRTFLAAGVAACLMTAGALGAQEHPKPQQPKQEHPKKEEPKKEHPTAQAARKPTIDELDAAIRQQIAEKAKATGGKFQIKDDVLDKTWSLELVRVHKDKLTQLDANTYFACVDFRADDGTVVDVDFYMKNQGGEFKLTDTAVHKVNGKPRFLYRQKDNFWERVKTTS